MHGPLRYLLPPPPIVAHSIERVGSEYSVLGICVSDRERRSRTASAGGGDWSERGEGSARCHMTDLFH